MAWRSRLSTSLHELRIVYCANSPASTGTREFIKKNYKELKGLNPTLPIYIRPADGILPQISARYERGRYLTKGTAEMNVKQVESVVAELEKMAAEVNASVSGGGFGGNTLKVATAGAK